MEFECENLTTLGCPRMDAVKELMLFEQIECDIELDLNKICKRQCCKDCDNKCSYECGRVKYLDPVEQFKKEDNKGACKNFIGYSIIGRAGGKEFVLKESCKNRCKYIDNKLEKLEGLKRG